MGRKSKGFWRRQGSRAWHTRDPFTGKRVSTHCHDLAAAQAWKTARERLAADPVATAAASAELGPWCDSLIEAKRAAGKFVKFYEQKLKPWRGLYGDGYPLGAITPIAFDQYVEHRKAGGVTNHTISKEVNCMLHVLRHAKRAGCFGGDLQALRPMDLGRGYVPRTRVLQPVELAALLGQLDEGRGAFVALCVGLGVRRSEAFALRPEHVDFNSLVVSVPGTKTAGAKRDVPILAPFLGLVRRGAAYLPLEPWTNYLRDMKAACRRAGIPHCTANDLRRTHATLLRSAGVDRDVMRRLLGHGAGSTMLETVYDKPGARELASRVGDLGTLESQLAGADQKSRRAREDSNLGPTAPEALLPSGQLGSIANDYCHLAATSDRVDRCRSVAKSTNESHAVRPCGLLVARPVFLANSRGWFRSVAEAGCA